MPARKIRKIKRQYQPSNDDVDGSDDQESEKKGSDDDFEPVAQKVEKMRKKIMKKSVIELGSDLGADEDD